MPHTEPTPKGKRPATLFLPNYVFVCIALGVNPACSCTSIRGVNLAVYHRSYVPIASCGCSPAEQDRLFVHPQHTALSPSPKEANGRGSQIIVRAPRTIAISTPTHAQVSTLSWRMVCTPLGHLPRSARRCHSSVDQRARGCWPRRQSNPSGGVIRVQLRPISRSPRGARATGNRAYPFSAVNLWPNAAQAYHHWIKASIGQNKTRWVQPRVRQKWQRREKVGQRRDLAC